MLNTDPSERRGDISERSSGDDAEAIPFRGRFQWIAFDAVGTLIYPEPSVTQAYFDAGRRHGSRRSMAEIRDRFIAVFRDTERNGLRGGSATLSEELVTSEEIEHARWRKIVAEVVDDVPNTDNCFDELFRHFAQPSSWRCFADVAETLTGLSAAGFRLAIASNFDSRLHNVCDALPELRAVTCRVVSAEVGFRKPSDRFYEALLERANCRSDALLMVGDDLENDIVGAREAGLAALLVARKQAPLTGEIGSLSQLLGLLSPPPAMEAPVDEPA